MIPGRARLPFLPLFLVLACLSVPHFFAQSSMGTLRGFVVDKDGGPLPGATVTLENRSLGVTGLGAVTDAKGEFRFNSVPAGKDYALVVSLPGHQKVEFAVNVVAGKSVVQNVTLPEEFKERVRVEGKSDVVNTESAQVSTTINSDFIAGLPVLGTDYQDLLTLVPGVTDVNGTGNPNVHGARDVDNLTLVNGFNTTDPVSGRYGQNLNAESIEEIEVVTGGAGAGNSGAQGGFIKILTKSGGNDFRGTFAFSMRTQKLDGDGAGNDPAELRGGLGETDDFRDLEFTDLYPYVSVSGPIVADHLWYFFAPEFIQEEEPINAGSQAFVARTTDTRINGRLTWQITPAQKLSFIVNFDNRAITNQEVGTRVDLESGYTFRRGGPTLTLTETAVFAPNITLESTLGSLHQRHRRIPTLDPDTNGNGILNVDGRRDLGGNVDGFVNLREGDPGVDRDFDGRWDVFEDYNLDGKLACVVDEITGEMSCHEDLDGDGRLTGPVGCEGDDREDTNCNGVLDFEGDRNQNGLVDPEEDQGIFCDNPTACPQGFVPGTQGNGSFDTEDRNGNQILDDTPFRGWVDSNQNGLPERGEFEAPLPPDRPYLEDSSTQRTTGPYFLDYDDDRIRESLQEELSWYVGDFMGSHDLRIGLLAERTRFDASVTRRASWTLDRRDFDRTTGQALGTIVADVPTQQQVSNSAGGQGLSFWIADVYKPLPNLTFNLGLHFDREVVNSHGFEFFDPAGQRREFDQLMGLGGLERDGDQNLDGIITRSLKGDPLYSGEGTTAFDSIRVEVLNSKLGTAAVSRLTRHNFQTSIESAQLGTFGIEDPLLLRNGRPRQPQDFNITNNNLSPRVSVSWDPWADGKTRASVSWGRLYGDLFFDSVVREEGPDFMAPFYAYDADGVDSQGLPNNKVGPIISKSPPSAFQVERGLKTPYTNEFLFNVQREIAPEVSVSFNYIRKKYLEQLQDVDVNHSVRRPGQGVNCNVTLSGYCDDIGDSRRSPSGGAGEAGVGPDARLPDGYADLYINNFNFNQIFRIGNYNVQDYTGYEVHFVRRLRRKWQMIASYVWSKATGQADSFDSQIGDDPALTVLRDGYQSFDQRHVARFFATAFLAKDWRVGGGIEWASGLPYSRINAIGSSSDNVDFAQSRVIYGYHQPNTGYFIEEDRNVHRNHATYRVDARVERQFVMGKIAAGAFFEGVDLLNTDDLRIFAIDDRAAVNQNLARREFGRRCEFGIKMNF